MRHAFGCALAMVMLAVTIGVAQPNDPQMHGRMLDKLNLTTEQQVKFRDMSVDFQKRRIESQARIRMAQIDLRQLMQADNPNRAAIQNQVHVLAQLQEQARLQGIDHMFALRSLLTPDQLKTWKERRMEAAPRMRERIERMRRGRHDMRGGFMGEGMLGGPDEEDGPGEGPDNE